MNREQTINEIKHRIKVDTEMINWLQGLVIEEMSQKKNEQPENFFCYLKRCVEEYEQRSNTVKTYRDYLTWLEDMED